MDPDPVGPSGVSPETARELHALESRRLRNKIAVPACAFVAALLLWSSVDRHLGSLLFVGIGLALAVTVATIRAWWKHRQIDPLAPSPNSPEDRERAREAVLAHQMRLHDHPPYMSYGVISCVGVVALLQVFVSGSIAQSVSAAGLVKPLVSQGQWWRLVSGSYLHAGFPHFWMNMLALLSLGRLMEAYSPRWRLPLVYAAAALGGGVASWWLLPGKSSLGASGAILGLAGYLVVLARRRPHDVPIIVGRGAMFTCVATGFIGLLGYAFIDNAAHAGGALTGALVAWLTVPRADAEPRPIESRGLDALGLIAAVFIVIGAAGTGVKLVHAGPGSFDVHDQADVVVPIRSATVSLRTGANGAEAVIENLTDKPIEAFAYTFSTDGAFKFEMWRDECCINTDAPNAPGPIPPHDRRAVPLPAAAPGRRAPMPDRISLTLVLFADQSFEGSSNSRDAIVAERLAVMRDLDFWIAAIDETLTMPVGDVEKRLFAQIDERVKAQAKSRQPVQLFSIPALARGATRSPQRYAADAEREKERLMAQRAAVQQRIPK